MTATQAKSMLKRLPWIIGLTIIGLIIVFSITGFLISANTARDSFQRERQPIEGTPADFGATDWEDVTLTTPDDITLEGWVVPSKNGAFIILAHGHGGNREAMNEVAAMFLDEGYGLAMFDFRAHGESSGDISTIGGKEVTDLITILDYVDARDDSEPERIGAVGFSMGAATVAQTAAIDDRIAVVSVEASFTSLREVLLHRAAVLGPISQAATLIVANNLGLDPDGVQIASALCDISPRPVYLVYGNADVTMFPDTAQQMDAASCEPSELWVVNDLQHNQAITLSPEEYEDRILPFFAEALLVD